MKRSIIILLTTMVLAGCNLTSFPATPTLLSTPAPTLEFLQPEPTNPVASTQEPTAAAFTATPEASDQAVRDRAGQVITALKDKDLTALAGYVSPTSGLRFSPYAAVQDTYQVFPADKIAGLFSENTIYTWGAYDGTGEPMDLTFLDYYSKFIYDVDFANAPQVSLNRRLGVSTTLDNAADYFPGSMIVEYYFPGFDPTLEGMDWRSLRLVFLQENNSWNLVGIIHDQWTT